jgi:hypothetical protein
MYLIDAIRNVAIVPGNKSGTRAKNEFHEAGPFMESSTIAQASPEISPAIYRTRKWITVFTTAHNGAIWYSHS